jgi:probable HAF family extracellular repeat protein
MSDHIAKTFRRFRSVVLLLSAATLCAASTNASAAPVYTFTDLGTLGGTYSYATGINDAGQVVGYSHTIGNAAYYATLWNKAIASNLGTLPGGAYSDARAINNAGDVAGYSYTVSGTHHATLWSGTTATDLGTLGGTHSYATAINTSGQVAGYSNTTGTYNFHATLWNGTTKTDLGTLGGASSYARSINTSGHVVGYADITGNAHQHATLWNGTTVTDLGTMGGTDSLAIAINDTDQVVGISYIAAAQHATLWNGTTAIVNGGQEPADSWLRGVEGLAGEGWSVVETNRGFGAAVGPPMMRQGGVSEGARRATGDTPPCRAPTIGEVCRGSAKGARRG